MLPLRARVDLGAMAMKGYSAFPKAPASDCLVSYSGHSLGESYPCAEKQSVYSTAPADWAKRYNHVIFIFSGNWLGQTKYKSRRRLFRNNWNHKTTYKKRTEFGIKKKLINQSIHILSDYKITFLIYIFIWPLSAKQNATQGQFLSGV